MTPADTIDFWRRAGPARWFKQDAAFDAAFREHCLAAHDAAARGALDGWASTAEGALALVILLDQFPRNAFRGTPRAYATDAQARQVASAALAAGFDRSVEPTLRPFLYLPFMHAESLPDQDRCVELVRPLGGEQLRYALHHRGIIERFGRFPHRNAILGRTSTPAELQFLREGGFSG